MLARQVQPQRLWFDPIGAFIHQAQDEGELIHRDAGIPMPFGLQNLWFEDEAQWAADEAWAYGKGAQDEAAKEVGYFALHQAGVPTPFEMMNLAAKPPQEYFGKKSPIDVNGLKNTISKGIHKAKKSAGMSKLNTAPAKKTLDQLVSDYGREFEYGNIDFARPMPYPGVAAAPVAYGDFPYADPYFIY